MQFFFASESPINTHFLKIIKLFLLKSVQAITIVVIFAYNKNEKI